MRRAWIAVALVGLVYLLRLDRAAGLVVDDAWYVLLGFALARGDGYQLINAPHPGLLPPNPPAFAALLSLVFRVAPHFPDNVWLLKSVSIAAMAGTGALTYVYVRRTLTWAEPLALGVAAAVALTPGFVFLATSTVMSECVFTCAQLIAIVLVDRRRDTVGTIGAGLVSGLVVLLRTAGVALPIGAVGFLLATRQWRRAAIVGIVVAVTVGPWLLYAARHAPTDEQRIEHGGAHAFTYSQEFWERWAGDPASGTVTVRDLPARVRANTIDVFGRDVAGILTPTLFRGASESGEEVIALGGGIVPGSMGSAPQTMLLSWLLSAVVTIGCVAVVRRTGSVVGGVIPATLAMVLLWPQWGYRFVLPLAPFVFAGLVEGLRALCGPRLFPRVATLGVGVLLGLLALDHAQYIALRHTGEPDWLVDARDTDMVIDWLRDHAAGTEVIASTNPALVFLRTGHQTIATDSGTTSWRSFQSRGVRYVVSLRQGAAPSDDERTVVRYQSPRRGFWVVELVR